MKKAWKWAKSKGGEWWVRKGVNALTGFAVGAVVAAGCIGTAGVGCAIAAGAASEMMFHFTTSITLDAAYGRKITGRRALQYLGSGAFEGMTGGIKKFYSAPKVKKVTGYLKSKLWPKKKPKPSKPRRKR